MSWNDDPLVDDAPTGEWEWPVEPPGTTITDWDMDLNDREPIMFPEYDEYDPEYDPREQEY